MRQSWSALAASVVRRTIPLRAALGAIALALGAPVRRYTWPGCTSPAARATPPTPWTRKVVTDCAGTVSVAASPSTRTERPDTSAPPALLTTGVTVAWRDTHPNL